jgi:hypothetical protein
MKNQFLLIIFFISSNAVFAQTKNNVEGNTSNRLEILIIEKYGFAKLYETGNVPQNGFIDSHDALISIKLSKYQDLYLSTGLGLLEFNGNRNLNGNTTSLKNLYVHIPLNFKYDINIFKNKSENQNIFFSSGIGLYGNNLLFQDTETIMDYNRDKNLGWNFGISRLFGLKFNVSQIMNFGIGYESQSDLSKMKNNNIERKIESSNTIYFSLGFNI